MPPTPPRPAARRLRNRLGFLRRTVLLVVTAGLPGFLVLLLMAATRGAYNTLLLPLALLAVAWWLGCVLLLRERLARPLRTISNLLAGLREGDYSFRARTDGSEDALAEVMQEVNGLVETMRQQRLGAMEATALLQTVMAEIEVAVFALDEDRRLRLANCAGARLLAQPVERLLGRKAAELGLGDVIEGEAPRTVQMTFGGATGRWRIQRRQIRQGGRPLQLLVISDLSRELREEERVAWQRLVRVLSHELNNSLAPVKSIAGSLDRLLQRDPLPADWKDDMRDGLGVIASRAESLNRFVGAYAQLARLPQPCRQPVAIGALVERVRNLETRVPVHVLPGPVLTAELDPDQLEQALINLLRNAADAVREAAEAPPAAGVRMGWAKQGGWLELWVEDDGPGLSSTTNLFVPFFTTKQKGSGIGLVLSRQIAEGHGGQLTLENRPGGRGCLARLRVRLEPAAS